MERQQSTQRLSLAAGTAGRITVAPPDATRKWLIRNVVELPNAALATDGTDYVTRQPFVGATGIATAVPTSSVGLTQGTAVNWVLTGVGSQLEATQAAPFTFRISQAASGKAYDCSVLVEYDEVRV